MSDRIHLSPPHLGTLEQEYVNEAIRSNWIAPLGPQVDAFEEEFKQVVGAPNAVATSSGTAALHLALLLLGVRAGDEVFVSDLTFSASIFPIRYQGATPVFIDSELSSWNMDPELLEAALQKRARAGRLPRVAILVHLYGEAANIDPILTACARYGVPVVEDAAESLGATYHGRSPGTFGTCGIFSFNGNKIITSSGGGMLVSGDATLISHARKLASQARDSAPHYEHSEIGYNYRLSNVLAAIGRGQLRVLPERVQARRQVYEYYRSRLEDCPGIGFMPEAPWGVHTRWLTCITIDPEEFGADHEAVRLALEDANIESRPVWKPMHLQPIFCDCEHFGGSVSEFLFRHGLCLPSGSSLRPQDMDRIVDVILRTAAPRPPVFVTVANCGSNSSECGVSAPILDQPTSIPAAPRIAKTHSPLPIHNRL